MFNVRSGYALAKCIDGIYYVMAKKRDNSTIIVFSAEIESIISEKAEVDKELGTETGIEVVRVIDDEIHVVKDPKPLKVGWRARGFRVDDKTGEQVKNI